MAGVTATELRVPARLDTMARPWAVLGVVVLGQSMVAVDSGLVNVAVPSIREDLGTGVAELQLVLAAYSLAVAALMVTGGRIGDLAGRRRLFLIGMGVFTLGALLAGLAPNSTVLIACRVVQGVGAALTSPQVMAMIQVAFPGAARARALAIHGTVLGLGAAVGQVGGGLLVRGDLFGTSWRPALLVQVPLGAAAIVAGWRVLPESRGEEGRRLDLVGAGILALAMVLAIYPLVQARQAGWAAWVWACLAASVVTLGLFLLHQRHRSATAGAPLLELALFRSTAFSAGLVVALALMAGLIPFIFLFTLCFQGGLGYDPLQASLTYAPVPIAFLLGARSSPRLLHRLGRRALTLGVSIMMVGTLLSIGAALLERPTLTWWTFLPGGLLWGFGQGIVAPLLLGFVLRDVPRQHAGAASGVYSTVTQLGVAVGVAIVGLIFASLLGDRTTAEAHRHAFAWTQLYNLGSEVLVLGLILLLPRAPDA